MKHCTQSSKTLVMYALSDLCDGDRAKFEQHLSGCRSCLHRLTNPTAFRTAVLDYAHAEITGLDGTRR